MRDTRSSVLSVPPPSPYISIMGSSGHRVYLRLSKPSSLKEQIRRRAWSRPRTQLLTVPFADLKAIVEEEVSGQFILIQALLALVTCSESTAMASELAQQTWNQL